MTDNILQFQGTDFVLHGSSGESALRPEHGKDTATPEGHGQQIVAGSSAKTVGFAWSCQTETMLRLFMRNY